MAVHRVAGGPRQTFCDLPLEISLSLESPGKEGQALGSLGGGGGGGVGTWPQARVSSIPAPQPELPWRVETAFTACVFRLWFWNFPTPPAIGCPAPHTLPQAQIGHMGRLSSYLLHPRGVGGWSWGGCHSATCGVQILNPLPSSIGGELGAEPRPAAPLPSAPHPWNTPAEKDREPRRQSPRLSHEK